MKDNTSFLKMAAIQCVLPKPLKPPKLANKNSICYCNALLQSLFNIDLFWNITQNINENDSFKKIAKAFSNAYNRYFATDLFNCYNDFQPFIDVSNEDPNYSQHDPAELLMKILETYQQFRPIFKFNENEDVVTSTILTIDTEIQNVAEGVTKRFTSNPDDFIKAPPYICVKIERVTGTGLNTNNIQINNMLKIKFTNEDDLSEESYALESIICHRNFTPTSGHFISIVIKSNEEMYYCNDQHIFNGLPENSSMEAIQSKCYILFYKKVSHESEEQHPEYFKMHQKTSSTKTQISSESSEPLHSQRRAQPPVFQ